MKHLENRMKQTLHIEQAACLTKTRLLELLHERFQVTDFSQAKSDVPPFVRDPFFGIFYQHIWIISTVF